MYFEFTVTAHNGEMTDTFVERIWAYHYAQANDYIVKRLNDAGWTVDKIRGQRYSVIDIRDKCDHITD